MGNSIIQQMWRRFDRRERSWTTIYPLWFNPSGRSGLAMRGGGSWGDSPGFGRPFCLGFSVTLVRLHHMVLFIDCAASAYRVVSGRRPRNRTDYRLERRPGVSTDYEGLIVRQKSQSTALNPALRPPAHGNPQTGNPSWPRPGSRHRAKRL